MRRTFDSKESSIIYRKIGDLHLTESRRMEAIHALQTAEACCDSFAWVFTKLGEIGDWLAAPGKLKHQ